MVSSTIKTRNTTIFIPTDASVYSKIVITADDDTDYTVFDSYSGDDDSNDLISNATIKRTATDRLSSFSFTISNHNGKYLNKFDGGEIVKFYADTTDATTLIFTGKIDNVMYGLSNSGFTIDIDGRGYPELVDKTITGIEAVTRSDVSLAGILYDNFSEITLTFWNGTTWAEATLNRVTGFEDTVTWDELVPTYPTTTIDMVYQHRKAWSVITEICKRAGLDAYIEYDGTKWCLRTFIKSSITNAGANIAYGVNLIGMNSFGVENTNIINRVIVYGKTESDNILLVKTENDTASQSNLWIKDSVINDSSLDTMDRVQEKANYELSEGTTSTTVGSVKTLCLPSLRPGDLVNISVPYCNVHGLYNIYSFTHSLGNSCTSDIQVTSKLKDAADLFIAKLNAEEITSNVDNPNDMTDSYTVYFNEDPSVMTHSGTEEVEGKLRLQDTETTGTATADTITTDQDVTECEFRGYENFETDSDVYYVSNTGGVTWEPYNPDSLGKHTFAIADNQLTFKMTLNRALTSDVSPAYESVVLLYK